MLRATWLVLTTYRSEAKNVVGGLEDVLRGARGQRKSEVRATGGRATDADVAAVGLDETPHDVEAEARAAAPGTVPEPVEDEGQVLVADAVALVGDGHADVRGVAAAGRRPVPAAVLHDPHRDRAVAVAHSVFHEVGEDLVDPVGVGPHLGQVVADVHDEPAVGLTEV